MLQNYCKKDKLAYSIIEAKFGGSSSSTMNEDNWIPMTSILSTIKRHRTGASYRSSVPVSDKLLFEDYDQIMTGKTLFEANLINQLYCITFNVIGHANSATWAQWHSRFAIQKVLSWILFKL